MIRVGFESGYGKKNIKEKDKKKKYYSNTFDQYRYHNRKRVHIFHNAHDFIDRENCSSFPPWSGCFRDFLIEHVNSCEKKNKLKLN